jgi:hypothetical protein
VVAGLFIRFLKVPAWPELLACVRPRTFLFRGLTLFSALKNAKPLGKLHCHCGGNEDRQLPPEPCTKKKFYLNFLSWEFSSASCLSNRVRKIRALR